jgi:exopolysaccharide production protein ExoZ
MKYANLQVLRAFAAINVVLFHAIGTATGYDKPTSLLEPLRGWGANGVDIFFVISGFVMAQMAMRKRIAPFEFLVDRLKRICPTYYALTLVMLLASLFLPQLMRSQAPSPLAYVSAFFFASQITTGHMPPVFVGWTLEYEMLFYVIFAAALFIGNTRYALYSVVSVLAVIAVSGFCKILVLEFGFGIIVAMFTNATKAIDHQRLGTISAIIGASLLALTIVLRPPDGNQLAALICYGLPSTLLVYGLVNMPQIKTRGLVILGDASYSIYLIQTLALLGCFKAISFLNRFLVLPNDLWIILSVLVSVISGLFLYYGIESPARRFFARSAPSL